MVTMFKGVGIYSSLGNVVSLRHCRLGVPGISLLGFLSGLLWLGAALRWLDIAEATQGPTTGSMIWFTGQFGIVVATGIAACLVSRRSLRR